MTTKSYDGYVVVTPEGDMVMDTFARTPRQAERRLFLANAHTARAAKWTDDDLDKMWESAEEHGMHTRAARLDIFDPDGFGD